MARERDKLPHFKSYPRHWVASCVDIHCWCSAQRVGACVCNYGKQRATDHQLVISEGNTERWKVGKYSHAHAVHEHTW